LEKFCARRSFSKYAIAVTYGTVIDNILGCLRMDAWPLSSHALGDYRILHWISYWIYNFVYFFMGYLGKKKKALV
jgi:hypothetical protein